MRLAATLDYHTLAEAWFLERVDARGLRHVRGAHWVSDADPGALAERAHGHVAYAHDGSEELVVELGDAVAHVIVRDELVVVRAAAGDRAGVEDAIDRVRDALPPTERGTLDVSLRFWWWEARFPNDVARIVRVPRWREIAGNYATTTAAQLAELVDWRDGPPRGGRLLVWHGPSGTGKTHAVEMLAGAWRAWADLHVITDPEQFLASPSYLMAVAGRADDAGLPAPDRWRVAVLEDAGEHIAADAIEGRDEALARLLNVCDGLLGQALRLLILVTTNRAPRTLHPALRRPGRQLAEVAFAPLTRDEAARWCATRGVAPIERERATLAELYAHAEGRAAPTAPAAFGFAAARPTS